MASARGDRPRPDHNLFLISDVGAAPDGDLRVRVAIYEGLLGRLRAGPHAAHCVLRQVEEALAALKGEAARRGLNAVE